MPELLEIRQLSAGYGPLRVLHEVDLTVKAGERIGLVGLNGHGKTTLIRAITHMTGWQQGSVRLDGAAAEKNEPLKRPELCSIIAIKFSNCSSTFSHGLLRSVSLIH